MNTNNDTSSDTTKVTIEIINNDSSNNGSD